MRLRRQKKQSRLRPQFLAVSGKVLWQRKQKKPSGSWHQIKNCYFNTLKNRWRTDFYTRPLWAITIKLEVKFNTSNLLNNFLVFILILGVILVFGVLKADGFNIYLFTVGILCIASVISTLYYQNHLLNKPNQSELRIIDLKENGISIQVNLTQCIVTDKTAISEPDYGMVDFTTSTGQKKKEKVKFEKVKGIRTRVIYQQEFKGTFINFYSEPLSENVDLIKMLIDHHKQATLYIDENDPTNYYFDLDFLYNKAHNNT